VFLRSPKDIFADVKNTQQEDTAIATQTATLAKEHNNTVKHDPSAQLTLTNTQLIRGKDDGATEAQEGQKRRNAAGN